MIFRHRFLNLKLGRVKENFVVTKIENKKIWEERGFKKIKKYPIYHYTPNPAEIIMLGVPMNIEQFGTETFRGSKILEVCTYCGTYGMGGPGFFGLKLQGDYGTRWLTYCIWTAGHHILYDNRLLECHPNYEEKYKPIITYDDYENSLDELNKLLCNMSISEIIVTKDSFEIKLVDNDSNIHTIQSFKYSDKFPEQGGTGKKCNSFDSGEMKDYLLVTYDETHLVV